MWPRYQENDDGWLLANSQSEWLIGISLASKAWNRKHEGATVEGGCAVFDLVVAGQSENRETDRSIAEEWGWGGLVVAGEEFIWEFETPRRSGETLDRQ